MIKLHIELKKDGASEMVYMPHTEVVEKLTHESFCAIRDKCEIEGWEIHSWTISEQLPYDEGYAAAMAGHESDGNPYAEHFWKHSEWWLGWDSHQESNS